MMFSIDATTGRVWCSESSIFTPIAKIFFACSVPSDCCIEYFRNIQEADQALSYISREIAICESLSDANEKAEEILNAYFHGSDTMPKDEIKISVDYTPGSDQEWKKGNYITIVLSIKIQNTDPFSSGIRETSNMVMIERDEK